MSPLQLLEAWRRAGIELRAAEGRIVVNAPKGAVTPEIAADIRTHKAEILELLGRAAAALKQAEAMVLELRPGSTNVPLFCICGVQLYQPLADALGDGQPVYGIFVPAEKFMFEQGADDHPTEIPSVAELAAQYLSAIRRQQPNGPYCLAGISFGGVLAFEVAQQLVAQGEEVRVLSLLDAILPRGMRHDSWQRVTGHLRRLAKQGPRHVLERLGALPATNAPGESAESEEVRKLALLRERIYARAMESYERSVLPYAGDAVIFRANDKTAFIGYEVDARCGWSGLVKGALDVHNVDGDHLGILSEPFVGAVARTLRAYLDRASGTVTTQHDTVPAARAANRK